MIAMRDGASLDTGFSTVPSIRYIRGFDFLTFDHTVLMHLFGGNFHQGDDRLFLAVENIDQLFDARHLAVDQIIRQHDGKRFITDEIARAQHRMTQTEGHFLPHRNDLGHLGDAAQHSDHFVIAAVAQDLLELRRFVEMIFDTVLAPAGNENDFFDAGVHRLLHHVLDRRNVDDRQQFLGNGFGRREKSSAQPGDRNHGFFYFHRDRSIWLNDTFGFALGLLLVGLTFDA
jgi:hypothetical protein